MSFTQSRCRIFILPVIGLLLAAISFIIISGLINTSVLMSLARSMTIHPSNATSSYDQILEFYKSRDITFFIGWAIALIILELIKLFIILLIAYALYILYLEERLMHLVSLFPSVTGDTKHEDDDDEIELETSHYTNNNQDISPRGSDLNFDDTTEEENTI